MDIANWKTTPTIGENDRNLLTKASINISNTAFRSGENKILTT